METLFEELTVFTGASFVSPKSIIFTEQPDEIWTNCRPFSKFFQGKILKKTINGQEKEITIVLLNPNEQTTQKLLDLQNSKIKELEQQGKIGFLVEKSKSEFEKLSDLKNGITIVAIDNKTGQLIAQTSFSLENLKDKQCVVYGGTKPTSYNPTELENFDQVEQLFEIKGTIVDSKFNGIGLSQELINFGTDVLLAIFGKNKVVIFSEINKSNGANIHIRLKDGFKILQEYKASDGEECYLLYKPLGEELKTTIGFEVAEQLYIEKKSLAKNSHVAQYISSMPTFDSTNNKIMVRTC